MNGYHILVPSLLQLRQKQPPQIHTLSLYRHFVSLKRRATNCLSPLEAPTPGFCTYVLKGMIGNVGAPCK
jgi:hypothetical protein